MYECKAVYKEKRKEINGRCRGMVSLKRGGTLDAANVINALFL